MNKFILINKEKNMTSFDVIRLLKQQYKHDKFGHTGTLDPMATGLLVIASGKEALKAIQFSNAEDKEYITTFKLGSQTDTGDMTGSIIEEKEINFNFDINKVIKSFIGKQTQTPPQYSAKKVNGKKAYEYAREGKFVELMPVEIQIKELELISQAKDEITLRALVSKGTYIRTLCEDIAVATKNVGTMKFLHRTKVGSISVADASSINEEIRDESIKDIIDIITLNKIEITLEQATKLKLGQRFYLEKQGKLALVHKNKVISIVENLDKMKIIRNFNENY